MFRRFRHKLFMLLQIGIVASGAVAVVLQPAAWRAVLLCTLGGTLTAMICGRIARRYLHATLGRLRRAADDIGRGLPATTLDAQPGDDMYKLTTAINVLATRLAEASQEEQRLNEELRRRERLAFLGELAASVAHEINNPLDGVQNCARILRRSCDDPQRAVQMLDLIDSGLGRIEQIVRRLLTLAREHVVRPAEGRMSEVVEAALEAVRPRMDGRIEIIRDFTADDDRVLVDRALMEQVFVNLVLNAVDSMADGGMLVVTIRRESSAAGQSERVDEDALCVDVADTGSGIAPEILPHIFEPFYTTKLGGKGTGLGLAIAARIVDAHRGTISVTPRREGGTIFTVRIPAAMGDRPLACRMTDQKSVPQVAGS
jgi:signal transduction histidine kinase